MRRAVFLDRDGVLIEDVDFLINPSQLRLLPGVPESLARIKHGGFCLIVISNQTVVARGLASEAEVQQVNDRLEQLLQDAGAPNLDGIYFCPHHPRATVPAYRVDCDCRKPKPGLLLRAASEHQLDLPASFLVGDRLTDVLAGARAGCRTVLVETGMHARPLIETSEPVDMTIKPDSTCADLRAAAEWILRVA